MGGDPAVALIAAGIGCRRDADAAAIVGLVRAAADRAGKAPGVLAAPEFRDTEPVREAARRLGLRLLLIDRAALRAALRAAQPGCVTHSAAALRHTGLSAVAEAAALAGAGPGARLLLPRIATASVTCALGWVP